MPVLANTAPSFPLGANSFIYAENGDPVAINPNATVTDGDVREPNWYMGTQLKIERASGASADDLFSATGNLVFSTANLFGPNEMTLSDTIIGTYTNAGGTLLLNFNNNADQARLNETLSSIAYSNGNPAQQGPIVLEWTFDDGSGDPLTATTTTTSTVEYQEAFNESGGTGNDVLNGGAAADTFSAGSGDDQLFGMAGDDSLDGGKGRDLLVGGMGNDTLVGGGGRDAFVFDNTSGVDTITDFHHDKLVLDMNVTALGPIGDGDTRIEGATTRSSPGGFNTSAELVIFKSSVAVADTTTAAAAVIGSATSAYEAGDQVVFAIRDGAHSAVYLFESSDADAVVSAGELTLIGVVQNASLRAHDFAFQL
jgi:hypothetical protein